MESNWKILFCDNTKLKCEKQHVEHGVKQLDGITFLKSLIERTHGKSKPTSMMHLKWLVSQRKFF
jgi:hypothetical protein